MEKEVKKKKKKDNVFVILWASLVVQRLKRLPAIRPGFDPWVGRSPGEGNGNPLQYSCLENPMEGEAWWATVHGVVKSRTRLSDFTYSLTYFRQGEIESESVSRLVVSDSL